MTDSVRNRFFRDALPAFLFLLLAFLCGAVIGYLKIDALRSWLYTSDLFSFDTVLQETLRGHWGLEFTYGNSFGDHAYLFLLLLAPIKLLLSGNMVYLLVLLGPISYTVSAILFFFSVKQIVHPWKAFFLSFIYLFGFTKTFQGLFEYIYGMHPDILAGFLAVSMAALLFWKEHNDSKNSNSLPQTIGAISFLCLLLSLKEEMAILAVLFFLVAFNIKRTVFHRNLLLFSSLFFAVDMIILEFSRTPFNRTNDALISTFIQAFQTKGLGYFFNNPSVNPDQLHAFWNFIGVSCLLFIAIIVFSERVHPYAVGLLVMGLAKLSFGAAVADFDLAIWHNFSGLVLMTAAVLFQFLFLKKLSWTYSLAALALLVLASGYACLTGEVPFIQNQIKLNTAQKKDIEVYNQEMSVLMKEVDPLHVVSIPIYTAKIWVGYRYSFYPRGIDLSPKGIADFVVFPINGAEYLACGYDKNLPMKELLKSFSFVTQTPHFVLLRRASFSEDEEASRQAFLRLYK